MDNFNFITRQRARFEPFAPFTAALITAAGLFALLLTLAHFPALEALKLLYEGAFGSSFAWQNTLVRAAPLMLTALCVALPARAGLIIIGGEGAFALGALCAAIIPLYWTKAPSTIMLCLMMIGGFVTGGLWISLSAWLRVKRGINETISSLLLSYSALAIFNFLVEGPFRDPTSLNKPSTQTLSETLMIGSIAHLEVHWGLVGGLLACFIAWIVCKYSLWGFALSIVGGNAKAARMVGLSVGNFLILASFLGGGAAGLAGMFEVSAVQGNANASLISGYGYAGILVSFAARHHPLAIIFCSIIIGGIGASGGLLQRRLDLPDAAALVFQGIVFIALLGYETLNNRVKHHAKR